MGPVHWGLADLDLIFAHGRQNTPPPPAQSLPLGEEFVELALELGIAPLEPEAIKAEMEHQEHKARPRGPADGMGWMGWDGDGGGGGHTGSLGVYQDL